MLSLLFHVSLSLSEAAASDPRAARLLNGDVLMTEDDYPAIAVDEQQEGSTGVRLKVSPTGFVESCRVVESSGYTSLDEQTCAIYRARARFAPARDGKGRPVASDYRQKVTWKLEGEPPALMPRQAWMTRSTVSVTAEQRIVDCKVEGAGFSTAPADCKEFMDFMRRGNSVSEKAEPVAGYSITETYFYPLPAGRAATPPTMRDGNQVARQVSEIVVGPDGRVSGCKGVRYSGAASPELDACEFLRGLRFVPVPGDGTFVATVVMTVYARTNRVT